MTKNRRSSSHEEPTIEFMTDDSGSDAPPPTVDLPPPADRYVDRIVAPSPFAPLDGAKDEGIVGWTDEDSAALADLTQDIVVDESSDNAIEVPIDSGLEEPVLSVVEESFSMDDGDPFADRDPEPEPVEPVIAAASRPPNRARSLFVPKTTSCIFASTGPEPSSRAARSGSWKSRCRCPARGSAIAESPCSCV